MRLLVEGADWHESEVLHSMARGGSDIEDFVIPWYSYIPRGGTPGKIIACATPHPTHSIFTASDTSKNRGSGGVGKVGPGGGYGTRGGSPEIFFCCGPHRPEPLGIRV